MSIHRFDQRLRGIAFAIGFGRHNATFVEPVVRKTSRQSRRKKGLFEGQERRKEQPADMIVGPRPCTCVPACYPVVPRCAALDEDDTMIPFLVACEFSHSTPCRTMSRAPSISMAEAEATILTNTQALLINARAQTPFLLNYAFN